MRAGEDAAKMCDGMAQKGGRGMEIQKGSHTSLSLCRRRLLTAGPWLPRVCEHCEAEGGHCDLTQTTAQHGVFPVLKLGPEWKIPKARPTTDNHHY